ncbi:MAG: H+/gluconate symporter and related permease-like protein [Cypionkella sp.]|uniref:YdcF family protein n=1 Tax=Cypionkella sp. TaxID=2811411 RepID=UPI002618DDC6|nr:YdcF family protein [Cypionkella sp.]MDB5659247.1 H+/gluconate symporter and related permease-like protein [Cypionkella sp.]
MDLFESRSAISTFLFAKSPVEAVDLAFVFCSPTLSSIVPAIALYHAGMTPRLLITGAGTAIDGSPEWSLYRAHAVAAGVPASAILVEKTARNSFENAAFGAAMIEKELGWRSVRSIAVCAKPFHMRRAIMTLRQHIPAEVRLVAQPPSDPGDLAADTWWQTPEGRRRIFAELGKISAYALKGDLSDV